MPRYYFHITNRRERLDNPKGMDLPGNAAAREEAVVLANEPQTRPGDAGPQLAGMVRHGRRPARAPGGFGADRRHAGRIRGLGGSGPENTPTHPQRDHRGSLHTAVFRGTFFEFRSCRRSLRRTPRRIRERPGTLWTNQQHGKED